MSTAYCHFLLLNKHCLLALLVVSVLCFCDPYLSLNKKYKIWKDWDSRLSYRYLYEYHRPTGSPSSRITALSSFNERFYSVYARTHIYVKEEQLVIILRYAFLISS